MYSIHLCIFLCYFPSKVQPAFSRPAFYVPPNYTHTHRQEHERETVISSVILLTYSQSAQAWITQFYLRITPCLPFLRKGSDGVTPNEVADNCSLLYSFINPEGMKG